MKFADIKPGMILYDRHKHRMGNTTIRTLGEWPVLIVSVSEYGAMAKWNGNGATQWSARDLEKLKTWSMYDDCAEVERGGLLSQVFKVTLKKGHKAPPPEMVTPKPEAKP